VSAAAEATGEAEARCTELQRQVDELQAQLAAIRAKEQSTTVRICWF
jgi:prefoldin subunit 5